GSAGRNGFRHGFRFLRRDLVGLLAARAPGLGGLCFGFGFGGRFDSLRFGPVGLPAARAGLRRGLRLRLRRRGLIHRLLVGCLCLAPTAARFRRLLVRLRLGFGREFGGLLFGARLRLLGIRDLGYRLALGICVATATTAAAPPALARPFAGLVFLGTRRFVALTVLVLGRLLAARLAVLAIAPAAATAAPAPLAAAFAVGTLLARFFLVLELEFVLGNRLVVVFFFDERGEAGDRGRPRAGAGDAHLGAFLLALGQ